MDHNNSETPDDFKLYSGDDSLTLPVMSIGGVGVVSVAGHIVGNEMQEMIKHFNAGEMKEASELHQDLLLFFKAMRSEEHTSELQSRGHLVCRLLLEKKNKYNLTIV